MYPKILIISRNTWNDNLGTSSTLTNMFSDYDPEKLAHIYIETKSPETCHCYLFFQISEISLIHKLFKWNTKTGFAFDIRQLKKEINDTSIARQETATMQYVRSHRSYLFSFAREILWAINGWKSKELRDFIHDFDPDVIWMDGSPLPLMNRLYNYVLNIAKKPAVIFMQDDIYTYKSCPPGIFANLNKWYLRKKVKQVVSKCNDMFVASPKMKNEYDKIFGFNSTFIAKSVNIESIDLEENTFIHNPIRMVYLGQVIYGRIYTLIDIANSINSINNKENQIELTIYTNNQIPESLRNKLLANRNVYLKPPVPYNEVSKVIAENDILVFVESFEYKYNKIARLSFSTKICDYLTSNKCIFAVGPSDLAPMEYLKNEDAAIIANSKDEISIKIKQLTNKTIKEYNHKSNECLKRNHDRTNMNTIIYGKLKELAENNCIL